VGCSVRLDLYSDLVLGLSSTNLNNAVVTRIRPDNFDLLAKPPSVNNRHTILQVMLKQTVMQGLINYAYTLP
jgi:hypothetical protein